MRRDLEWWAVGADSLDGVDAIAESVDSREGLERLARLLP